MLVFGAGTDYALLLISRYRDELRSHESRYDAMAVAVRRTAEAVLASATTVVLGLLTLLLSLVPTTRGLGLACAVGVVVAAAFVLVVLPAALVLFGRWVFWPRVPHAGDDRWSRRGPSGAGSATGSQRDPRRSSRARCCWSSRCRSGLLGLQTGLDQADQFLDDPRGDLGRRPAGRVVPGRAPPTRPRCSPAPTPTRCWPP